MSKTCLVQLYGLYRANMAAKQYALMNEFSYKYKIRLRPDCGIIKPIPLPYEIVFTCSDSTCSKIIYHPNKSILLVGAEDTFNIGEAEDMDHVLDRYVDLTTKQFIYRPHGHFVTWTSETYLAGMLDERYNISLRQLDAIWMVVLRKPDHPKRAYDKEAVSGESSWIEMTAKTAR
jgi:hypothetical protein